MSEALHVGYILKQYPRLSETFILNEILGLEANDVTVSVFSLRHATEGRFHPALGLVEAPVHYVDQMDKRTFLDAVRALPSLRSDRLPEVVAFLDRIHESRQARLVLNAIEVADRARRTGVTHLHCHFLTVAAHTAHLVHLLTELPYSVTAHAKDIYRHTVDWDLANHIAAHASAVVTVCEANRHYLAGRLDAPNLIRVYNGLGPQDPPTTLAERTPGLVLGVGRLVEKKGFDLLLDAIAKLVPGRPETSCVIVGDGDQRGALEAQTLRLGIDQNVTFVGAQPQQEVAGWLRRAHVLAAPCRVGTDGNQDALPTVLIEALGAGLPSVTTNVAGIPEIVDHGREGLIVANDDAGAIASGIETILDDPSMWVHMSAAGPPKLARLFDREATIAQLISAFVSAKSS